MNSTLRESPLNNLGKMTIYRTAWMYITKLKLLGNDQQMAVNIHNTGFKLEVKEDQ
jgi:hypothetical protein